MVAKSMDVTVVARNHDWMRLVAKWLTPREVKIVRLYYWRNLSMAQIGIKVGLTESRICQIHDRILLRLRSRLAGLDNQLERAKRFEASLEFGCRFVFRGIE